MTSDVVFVVMLGAAVWTSIQLSTGPRGLFQRMTLSRLCHIALIEGLVCAVIWSSIHVIATRALTNELIIQSVGAGCIWTSFTLFARMHFRAIVPAVE